MKYTMTSAEASKLLKKLTDEKEMLLRSESQSCTFCAALGENVESVRPAYDYRRAQTDLAALNDKIRTVKHAVNCFNASQLVGDTGLTIDQVLIRMPQLHEMRVRLARMQDRLPKQRVSVGGFGSSTVIDYEYANYDVEEVRADYTALSDELRALQVALDIVNSTVKLEFELPD